MPQALYKLVLIISVFLIIFGILIELFSVFSPLWEIVEIPRLHVTHQHGLWLDCKVHHNTLIPLDQTEREQRVDICENKFDSVVEEKLKAAIEKGDSESRELSSHRFQAHHKGVLFFTAFTLLFGLIGALIGICSPCFPPNSLFYVVSIFMTAACSVLADIIFVFAVTEQQDRRLSSPPSSLSPSPSHSQLSSRSRDIGILIRSIGFACYLHMLGSILFVIALVFSIVAAYLLITTRHARDVCCTSKKEYLEEERRLRWQNSGITLKTGVDRGTRPFVVVDEDSSSA